MSVTRRSRGPSDITPYLALAGLGLLLLVVAGVWVAVAVAAALGHAPAPPANPFTLAIQLAVGQRAWPGPTATVVAAAELLVAAA
ncbi:hypothetical protein TR74_06430, partial [Carbonactinospora thermoautotrophica]